MRILVDLLESKLETDNPDLLAALYNRYGFFVPGYNYVNAYKKRYWDGKKRYFSKDGRFRSGILHRILKDLDSAKAKNIEIKSSAKALKRFESLAPVKKYKYRDYQEEAILEVLEKGRLLLDSPVGSGKTLIMAGILATLQRDNPEILVTILFREKGILGQTYDFLKLCGIKNLGRNSGEGFIHGNIMLSTVQSISRIIDTHIDSEVLMVDEVHQFCKGDVTVAAIESFPKAVYRVGFTATIPTDKEDIHGRLTLEGAFGEVFKTRTTDDLIKEGKLAKPIIQIIDFSPSGVDEGIKYQDAYDQYIVHSDDRNAKILTIVNTIRSNNKNSKTLILVKNLEHVQILNLAISNSFTIEGKHSLEERYDLIQSFKDTNSSVLIGTNVLQTGININEITHMINARGLEGEIPTIQGLGRGLRISEGKTHVYFYDFMDNVPYLDKHSRKRIKHYKNLKFEINYVNLN